MSAGKQLPDGGENAGVGGGIGARGAANGALVDIHAFVQQVQSLHVPMGGGLECGGFIEHRGGEGVEGAVDQG